MIDVNAIRDWTRRNQRARDEYHRDPLAATNAYLQADRDAASRRMRRLRAARKDKTA